MPAFRLIVFEQYLIPNHDISVKFILNQPKSDHLHPQHSLVRDRAIHRRLETCLDTRPPARSRKNNGNSNQRRVQNRGNSRCERCTRSWEAVRPGQKRSWEVLASAIKVVGMMEVKPGRSWARMSKDTHTNGRPMELIAPSPAHCTPQPPTLSTSPCTYRNESYSRSER